MTTYGGDLKKAIHSMPSVYNLGNCDKVKEAQIHKIKRELETEESK